MTRRPDVELLGNGDILVPGTGADGSAQMSRVTPDDPEYAGLLADVQQSRRASVLPRIIGFSIAAPFVWFGFVLVVLLIAFIVRVLV